MGHNDPSLSLTTGDVLDPSLGVAAIVSREPPQSALSRAHTSAQSAASDEQDALPRLSDSDRLDEVEHDAFQRWYQLGILERDLGVAVE